MRGRLAALALLALLASTVTACDDEAPGVGSAAVDVDTPQLRQLKREAGVAPCEPGSDAPVDGGLPDVTLACLGGGPHVDVSALRGPLVVNLWASWCTTCREEMPILQRFHDKYADRVGMLGIDYQDVQPVAAMQLVGDSGVTYPLLADPQAALSGAAPLPVIRGLPMLVLVGADGRITYQKFVEIKSLGQLEQLVRDRLGVDL